MFGKAEWFRPKRVGWGLHPIVWQGWLFTVAWMGVVGVPFIALVLRHQVPEALVWLASSLSLLGWEVHSIRRQWQKPPEAAVLYIHEDGTCT